MDATAEAHGFIALLTTPWFLVVVAGTIVLGVAIAYGMLRGSRRSAAEKQRTEAGTRDIYHKDGGSA